MAEAEKLADEAAVRAAATDRQLAAAEEEIRRLRRSEGARAQERIKLLEDELRSQMAHIEKLEEVPPTRRRPTYHSSLLPQFP